MKNILECVKESNDIGEEILRIEVEIKLLQQEVIRLKGKKEGIWWTFLCKSSETTPEYLAAINKLREKVTNVLL